jgi:hypothetical protein
MASKPRLSRPGNAQQHLPTELKRRLAWLYEEREQLSPDEWARKNRTYPLSAGVPGPRNPSLTPYIIPFLRFFDDPQYEVCTLITGTQMSKTDGVLDVMGWRLDTKPRPQLYVGPSKDFVSEQFEPRLMKLFDEAPRLAALVARGKRNKKTRKTVAGVSVRLAWAGSATSLASDQAGDVYIDEFDKMVGGVRSRPTATKSRGWSSGPWLNRRTSKARSGRSGSRERGITGRGAARIVHRGSFRACATCAGLRARARRRRGAIPGLSARPRDA